MRIGFGKASLETHPSVDVVTSIGLAMAALVLVSAHVPSSNDASTTLSSNATFTAAGGNNDPSYGVSQYGSCAAPEDPSTFNCAGGASSPWNNQTGTYGYDSQMAPGLGNIRFGNDNNGVLIIMDEWGGNVYGMPYVHTLGQPDLSIICKAADAVAQNATGDPNTDRSYLVHDLCSVAIDQQNLRNNAGCYTAAVQALQTLSLNYNKNERTRLGISLGDIARVCNAKAQYAFLKKGNQLDNLVGVN